MAEPTLPPRVPDAVAARPTSRRGHEWNGSLVIGLVLVGVVVGVALVSFVWTPYAPMRVDTGARLLAPSGEHWLGTDKFGRDLVSLVMAGARTTLFVGL